MKHFTIPDPLYDHALEVYANCTNEEGKRINQRFKEELYKPDRRGRYCYADNGWSCVFIHKGEDIAAVVHELSHHAVRVMEVIGHKITDIASEPFIYYLEYLLREYQKHTQKKH